MRKDVGNAAVGDGVKRFRESNLDWVCMLPVDDASSRRQRLYPIARSILRSLQNDLCDGPKLCRVVFHVSVVQNPFLLASNDMICNRCESLVNCETDHAKTGIREGNGTEFLDIIRLLFLGNQRDKYLRHSLGDEPLK